MLKRIRDFFDSQLSTAAEPDAADPHALHLATAALLIEVARQDEEVAGVELDAIAAAIQRKFDLSEADTGELMALADAELQQSIDYYQFTSLINDRFSPAQKERVVEHLWEVAFADGRIDRYEEHLIRRLADLLYVPHAAFIAAKHRASANAEKT